LNALDEAIRVTAISDKIDVLAEPFSTLPLWRRVDRHYWWNEWMSKPFVDAGVSVWHLPDVVMLKSALLQLHSFILPIMQGHYQISSFNVAREPVEKEEGDHAVVDYVIVSRRSRDRAGLRYQRRGVDDEAHVANFVETETIMRVEVRTICLVKSPKYNLPLSGKGIVMCLDMFKFADQVCTPKPERTYYR